MTAQTIQTIQVDAAALIRLTQGLLPILEAAGVATGPAGMAVAGAAAVLLPLLSSIPIGTVITPAEQLALMQRAQALAFAGTEWQLSK